MKRESSHSVEFPRAGAASELGPLGVERPGLVDPLVGVGPEEVSLGLDQVRRKPGPPVGVEVREARAHPGSADPGRDREPDDSTPRCLTLNHLGREIGIDDEIGQVHISLVGLFDPIQKHGPNDTPAFPDPGHLAQVDSPSFLRTFRPQQIHPLQVKTDIFN